MYLHRKLVLLETPAQDKERGRTYVTPAFTSRTDHGALTRIHASNRSVLLTRLQFLPLPLRSELLEALNESAGPRRRRLNHAHRAVDVDEDLHEVGRRGDAALEGLLCEAEYLVHDRAVRGAIAAAEVREYEVLGPDAARERARHLRRRVVRVRVRVRVRG